MQILGGALLGHAIDKEDIRNLRRMIKPVILLVLALITLNIAIGYLLNMVCGFDMATSMFASAPGGVSDMALIADELGANTTSVSILQLFRLFGIYIIYPPLFRIIGKRVYRENLIQSQIQKKQHRSVENKKVFRSNELRCFLLTLIVSFTGGVIFIALKVPAGGMVGAVIASSILNIKTSKGYFPDKLRLLVQVGVGALIGKQMTRKSFSSIDNLLIPIVLMIVSLIIFTAILGVLMYKTSRMDLLTSLLAITPGGIQEISLIAEELGCNTSQVIAMHTIRLIAVICIFPSLLKIIIYL
jgi:membrane AbrB-like protein